VRLLDADQVLDPRVHHCQRPGRWSSILRVAAASSDDATHGT
jgi:hypothetical protein